MTDDVEYHFMGSLDFHGLFQINIRNILFKKIYILFFYYTLRAFLKYSYVIISLLDIISRVPNF